MKVLMVLCVIAFANISFAEEELIPPFAKHINNLSLQGKWFELQDISKALLKRNPRDITGLYMKAFEELLEFKESEFNLTLEKLKVSLEVSNLEKEDKRLVTSLTYDILISTSTNSDLSHWESFSKLNKEEQKRLMNTLYSGEMSLYVTENPALSLLEEEGILTFEGLDIAAKEFPFVDYVDRMWHQRPDGWRQVSSIAERLLERDSDHIAGLILKASYELKALQYDQMKSTISQVEKVGKEITTERFVRTFPILKIELHKWLNYIANQPNSIVKTRQGSLIKGGSGGSMMFKRFLLECEEDGLVSMADLEKRKSSNYYLVTIPVVLLMIGFAVYLRRRGQKVEDAPV